MREGEGIVSEGRGGDCEGRGGREREREDICRYSVRGVGVNTEGRRRVIVEQ